MKYFEVWENNGKWLVYEVTNDGQHYVCIKSYKTRAAVDKWASKQWYRVIFHD